MKLTKTTIDGLFVLEPAVYGDSRGFFYESWNERLFQEVVGQSVKFVQDNHSRSQKGVLRGLHYQRQHVQGKLVRVTHGRVWDVAVDLRKGSPSFGAWWGTELSETNHRQLWVPEGMAHGFLVLSEMADFLYKTTDYWHAASERSLLWNDPDIGIEWPLDQLADVSQDAVSMLKMAAKDRDALRLCDLQRRGELEVAR